MTLKDAPRIKWHQQNPPGLPGWPLVDTSKPGIVIVAGKVQDNDMFDMRAFKAILLLVACLWIFCLIRWHPNYLLAIYMGCLLSVPAGLIGYFIGAFVAAVLSLPFRELVVLEFRSSNVEIIMRPLRERRLFDVTKVPKFEFHATLATPSDPSDGIAVNLVYGAEVVRLFRVSQTYHQAANDFAVCCQWAATRAWSTLNESSEIKGDPQRWINDLD